MTLKKADLNKYTLLSSDGSKSRVKDIHDWLVRMGFERAYNMSVIDRTENGVRTFELSCVRRRPTTRKGSIKTYQQLTLKAGQTLAVEAPPSHKLMGVYVNVDDIPKKEVVKADPDIQRELTERQWNWINRRAPHHDRSSCNDENTYNGWFGPDDHTMGRCIRCSLIDCALGEAARDDD